MFERTEAVFNAVPSKVKLTLRLGCYSVGSATHGLARGDCSFSVTVESSTLRRLMQNWQTGRSEKSVRLGK